jgi:hypothetical protein
MEEKLGGWDEVDAGEMMIEGERNRDRIGKRIEMGIGIGTGNY